MAKKTLLEIVQDILNDIDGDEVNSINDTIESAQVANIVKSTFEALITERDWPHTKGLIQLTASGSSSKPTHMTFPDAVSKIIFINYNKIASGETKLKFQQVKYMNSDDFLYMLNTRDSTESTVDSIVDDSGITLLIRNDKAPSYYTSFDDETLVFDSYDSAVDSTLQTSKTQAMVYRIPTFTLSDTYYPDLPDDAFPFLIEEAKSRCSLKLRQEQDVKSEQEAQRQRGQVSQNLWTVNGGIKYPNYGRGRSRKAKTTKEQYQ